MSRFVKKVKDIGQKALEVKAALEQAPETVAGIRRTLDETKDQLQQLQTEVVEGATELKAGPRIDLDEVLKEVAGSREILAQAGTDILGIDIETEPVPRVVVRLQRKGELSAAVLESLIAAHRTHAIRRVLLKAVRQGEAMTRRVSLGSLDLSEIRVQLGAVTGVRLCFREQAEAPSASVAVPEATLRTSYFEKPPQASTPLSATTPGIPESTDAPIGSRVSERLKGAGNWSADLLERFKTMPGYSKYGK